MGCSPSIHPSIYDETVGKGQRPSPPPSSLPNTTSREATFLQGTYTDLQVAKHRRLEKMKERQNRSASAADELSHRVLEERETLSLGTRSRATSRNTSRAASPSTVKRSVHFRSDEQFMEPVTETEVSQKKATIHFRESRVSDEKKLRSSDQPSPFPSDENEELKDQGHSDDREHKKKKKHKKKHKKSKESNTEDLEIRNDILTNQDTHSNDAVKERERTTQEIYEDAHDKGPHIVNISANNSGDLEHITRNDVNNKVRSSQTNNKVINEGSSPGDIVNGYTRSSEERALLRNGSVLEIEAHLSRSSTKSDIDTKRG